MSLASIAAALIDRPGQAMRAAAARPRSWWLPALVLIATLVTYVLVTASAQLALANEQSAAMIERITAGMSEEQAQLVREQSSSLTMSTFLLSALGGGLATMAIGWLARGTLLHLGALLFGGVSTWGATFAIALWAMLPFAVRDLVMTAVYLVQGRLVAQPGLAFLVSSGDVLADSRSALVALMGNLDPFVLWHLVLLAIAIPAATQLGRGRAVILAVLVWAILTGVKLIPTVIAGALLG